MTARIASACTPLLGGLLVLALTGPVRADFIRFEDQDSGPPGLLRLSFPQFDPALGTLTNVRWGLTSGVSGQVAFDNELLTPVSRQLDIVVIISASLTGGVNVLDLNAGQVVRLNLAADDEPGLPPDFAGPDSRSFRITGGNFEDPAIRSTSFPAYIGNGTVGVIAASFPRGISPGSGISVLTQQPFNVSLHAALTYEFTPVPEPSTLAMLGIASVTLFGCGWRRWKRVESAVAKA